jgi:hypothetical protein
MGAKVLVSPDQIVLSIPVEIAEGRTFFRIDFLRWASARRWSRRWSPDSVTLVIVKSLHAYVASLQPAKPNLITPISPLKNELLR